ncbi:Protein NUCLEAR FUSION DEFECTIVE 4, partial [Cucurbita argyrosperma subsp. argyrosperma]
MATTTYVNLWSEFEVFSQQSSNLTCLLRCFSSCWRPSLLFENNHRCSLHPFVASKLASKLPFVGIFCDSRSVQTQPNQLAWNSAALYTLMANAIDPNDANLYLLLNALVPLIIYVVTFLPILHQPPAQPSSIDATRNDSLTFIYLYNTAVITGLYLITFNSTPSSKYEAQILLAGAFSLLLVPLCLPGIWSTHKWLFRIASTSLSSVLHFRSNLVNNELQQELINLETERSGTKVITPFDYKEKESISRTMMGKENLTVLEEEHSAKMLVRRLDFWLYFVAYFCGGTIELVYSNNLGHEGHLQSRF